MALLWLLPVVVVVAGVVVLTLVVGRVGAEAAALREALRRAGRVAVGAQELQREVTALGRTAATRARR